MPDVVMTKPCVGMSKPGVGMSKPGVDMGTCDRWGEGLHQAVEAKEQLPIQNETITLASISYQVTPFTNMGIVHEGCGKNVYDASPCMPCVALCIMNRTGGFLHLKDNKAAYNPP